MIKDSGSRIQDQGLGIRDFVLPALRLPPVPGDDLRRVAGLLPFLGRELLFQIHDAGLELHVVPKSFGLAEPVRPSHLEHVFATAGVESRDELYDPVAAFKKPNHTAWLSDDAVLRGRALESHCIAVLGGYSVVAQEASPAVNAGRELPGPPNGGAIRTGTILLV
jgi:hypothetical protein